MHRMQKSDDIRGISDQFCSDGNTASSAKLTNMVWGFGQFLGAHPSASTHRRSTLAGLCDYLQTL